VNNHFRVLMLGDVIGQPGRRALNEILPSLKKSKEIDFIGINGENLAGGFGLTEKTVQEAFFSGISFITTGNHVWDKKDGLDILKRDPRILRPANYPEGAPGRGYTVLTKGDVKVGIINLQGRKYLPEIECPFRRGLEIAKKLREEGVKILLTDLHAEVTSEKVAMGWYLDGKVSMMVGTHTHVQTSDSRILPNKTAYQTDLGMCGARDSVIGMRSEIALERFLTGLPVRFEVAKGPVMINGLMADLNPQTGEALAVERIWVERT